MSITPVSLHTVCVERGGNSKSSMEGKERERNGHLFVHKKAGDIVWGGGSRKACGNGGGGRGGHGWDLSENFSRVDGCRMAVELGDHEISKPRIGEAELDVRE